MITEAKHSLISVALPHDALSFIEDEVSGLTKELDLEFELDIDGDLNIKGEINDQESYLQDCEHYNIFWRDYRISQSLFLQWLRDSKKPSSVLYPASGSDIIPKLVFGNDRVVHTSLEDKGTFERRKKRENDKQYFPDLGDGHKVIADNARLPFKKESFAAITLFGLKLEHYAKNLPEFVRVLQPGGIITTTHDNTYYESISEFEDIFRNHPKLEPISVPTSLQKQGESETTFFAFRKRM